MRFSLGNRIILGLFWFFFIQIPILSASSINFQEVAEDLDFPDGIEPESLKFVCAGSEEDLISIFKSHDLPFDPKLVKNRGGQKCHIWYEPTVPGFRADAENDPIRGLIFDVDTLSFQQRKNLGSYSPKGFEAGVTLHPHRQLTLSGTYSYLDPGDFTFQTSKNRFNLGALGFVPIGDNRIEGEITYRYTGDGYFFDYETRPFDAFATSDARVSFAYREMGRISLYVKNMFDETYQLWHYAWQPGRTVLLSIETRY